MKSIKQVKNKVTNALVLSTFLAGALIVSNSAHAAFSTVTDKSCCAQGAAGDICRAELNGIDAANVAIVNEQLGRITPTPASVAFNQSSCLDLLMNTKININVSVMAADAIVQAIINAVKNGACGAVMGAWNQALAKVNNQLGTSVAFPIIGTVIQGGVNVGSSSTTSGSIVNMQGNTAQTLPTYSPTTVQRTAIGTATGATNFGTNTMTKIRNMFR